MTEEEFWQYISLIDIHAVNQGHDAAAVESLLDHLAQHTVPNIESFYNHLANALYELDTKVHWEQSGSKSEDNFLYERCYVIGMGRKFFDRVLSDPSQMPNDIRCFEHLLSVPSEAWSQLTGKPAGEWDYVPVKNFETFSNKEAWDYTPGLAYRIYFEESKELIEELIAIDASEKASVGVIYHNLAQQFCSQLQFVNFRIPYCESICLGLTPVVNHGQVRVLDKGPCTIRVDVGVRPKRYLQMSEIERLHFIIDLIASAVAAIGDKDGTGTSKVERAREALYREMNIARVSMERCDSQINSEDDRK